MPFQQTTLATPRMDLAEAFMEYDPLGANFIGYRVLSMFGTPKREATFSAITRESMLKPVSVKRATSTAFARADMTGEDVSYACEQYGIEYALDDEERELYATDFDAEEAATQHAWLKLMLAAEERVETLVFNTSTWTGADLYTDNSSAPWDTVSTDIIGQVLAAAEIVRLNTGVKPNSLVIGAATLANMLKNTGIKAQFAGEALITRAKIENALPAIMGLEQIIVGGAVYDSAVEGQTYSGADIWSEDYAMVARLARPGDPLKTPCIGRSFLWTPMSAEEVIVEQYREEQTTSEIFRARHHVDELIIDPYFGHLLCIDA